MTFYYHETDNDLEGNQLGQFTEVDGAVVTIDVDGIMEEGRGVDKLREMQNAIQNAIDANEADNGGEN